MHTHTHTHQALIYMALEQPEGFTANQADESRQVIESLAAIEVEATDITGNDLAKTHARYLAGGPGMAKVPWIHG